MKIKDIGNVVTGKTPQTAHAEFYGGDYMFITPTELHGGYWLGYGQCCHVL